MVQYIAFALLLGIIAAVAAFDKESKEEWLKPVIVGGITFTFFGIANYWWMPVINFWGFDGLWIELVIAAAIGLIFSAHDSDGDLKAFWKMWQAIPAGICILLFMVRCSSTAEMFHSGAYSELLQPKVVEDSTFANNVHPIPVEKMISVKQAYREYAISR